VEEKFMIIYTHLNVVIPFLLATAAAAAAAG